MAEQPGQEAASRGEEAIGSVGTRLFRLLVGLRVASAPAILVLVAVLVAIDPRPARVALILLMTAFTFGVFAWEHRKLARGGDAAVSIPLNLLVVGAIQLTLIVVTGALSSPFLPAVLLLSSIASLVLGPHPFRRKLVALVIVALFALAAAQAQGWTDPLSPAWLSPRDTPGLGALRPWIVASVSALLAMVMSRVGVTLRGVFDTMLTQAIEARQDVLRTHHEQARDLTALSGEIAHELKNPLTSIKGLAGLLALDTAGGKPAERLATLRREVDRMQGILEEFLNFSRPMVPLSQETFDAGALCHDVASLYEGVLRAQGLRIAVDGAGAVRADPRKVRQILINLVKNAVEASPAGGTVRLRVREDAGARWIDVEDDGPGLPPEGADRLFEAGVTTKRQGSGLGLTIARSLARQHGGELVLRDRVGGGCQASFWIPIGGAP